MPLKPGDIITAEFLNDLAANIVRNITVTGGRVSRHGQNIVIEVTPGRSGGSGNFVGVVSAVDGGSGLAKVRKFKQSDSSRIVGETSPINDTILDTAEQIVVCGKLPYIRKGDIVLCVHNGSGANPTHTALPHIKGIIYDAPTNLDGTITPSIEPTWDTVILQ